MVRDIRDLVPVLEQAMKSGKPLVIVAGGGVAYLRARQRQGSGPTRTRRVGLPGAAIAAAGKAA
jgi:chaperonin GroEL (HSP60 family)